ncbi:MAG: PACE efflux transporter [Kiloniellales bacterium]
MSQSVALRSGKDRLRYTVAFEVSLMAMLVPAGAAFFDKGLEEMGLLGLVLSLKAMVMGLLYNWVFDRFYARTGRVSSDRRFLGRVLHALGFELSLMTTSLPIYVWWLGITLLEALATDLVVTSFLVVYTFVFTLAYDRLFPVRPQGRPLGQSAPLLEETAC